MVCLSEGGAEEDSSGGIFVTTNVSER